MEVSNEERLREKLSLAFSKAVYRDWMDLFVDVLSKHRFVIFDEFQNFYRVAPEILYSFQQAWDEVKNRDLNVKVFLLGSYQGLIQKLFYNAKLPLLGRKGYMMNLREFDLKTAISILSQFGYDPEEAFKIYAIIGGIPSFIWSSEERKTVEEKNTRTLS